MAFFLIVSTAYYISRQATFYHRKTKNQALGITFLQPGFIFIPSREIAIGPEICYNIIVASVFCNDRQYYISLFWYDSSVIRRLAVVIKGESNDC